MSIFKSKGEVEGIFSWEKKGEGEDEDSKIAEVFNRLNRELIDSEKRRVSQDEVIESFKVILKEVISAEDKDSIKLEVARNKFGDIVRLGVYGVGADGKRGEYLFYTDRQALISEDRDINRLYDLLMEAGINTVEKKIIE